MMRFNVSALLMAPTGEVRHVDVSALLDASEDGLRTIGPVRGCLQLMRCPDGILVQGTLSVPARLECARCLSDVDRELELELEEVFRPTVGLPGGPSVDATGEDPATLIDELNVLDLAEVVRQGMLLAVPAHPLCSAACKGLCSHCGADLNEGPCDCGTEADARWAALRGLLAEDGE